MKTAKKILLILLTLIMTLSLFACGGESDPCTEHTDADKDGKCDVCEATVEVPDDTPVGLELIKDGEVKFQFVTPAVPTSKVLQAVDGIVRDLKKIGITVERVDDKADNVKDCEILIGDIKNRGDKYDVDDKALGAKGYEISIIDNKLIVTAGTEEGLLAMITRLREDIIGLTDKTKKIENVTVTEKMTVKEVQDNYRVTNISVDGKEINTFFIKVDKSENLMLGAAKKFQEMIYNAKGYWLEIYDEDDGKTGNCIDFRVVSDAGENGLRFYVEEGNLVIETEFPNKAEEIVTSYFTKNVTALVNKGVDFKKTFTYTECVRYVYYSEFTVMENGKKNDFKTMKDCHEYANKYGHTVRADAGASYYIGDTNASYIRVMTDVEWGNATFLIDDKACTRASKGLDIFNFSSSLSGWGQTHGKNSDIVKALEGGFKADEMTNIGFSLGYGAILVLEDTTTYAYNRYGTTGNGSKTPPAMKEITRIDAEGNIMEGCEFLFDFPTVTSVVIYRTDDKPITISGGIFTTEANEGEPVYDSWARGLYVNRSNVTIKNVVHKIQGEKEQGQPYGGFISFKGSADLLCENLTLQGHKTYQDYQEDGTIKSNMGTYDISGNTSVNVVFKDCIQSNFYKDKEADIIYKNTDYWGIMGSSYCKNITYDGCTLSRIDAHAGMYNVTLKNSTLGWIQLTGGGTAYFENTTCYDGANFVTLRGDYGSTWDGEIILKNCYAKNAGNEFFIISGGWHNWSFYENHQCTLPDVTIDNLTYKNPAGTKYIYKLDTTAGDVTEKTITVGGISEPNVNVYNLKVIAIVKNNTQNVQYELSKYSPIVRDAILIFQ